MTRWLLIAALAFAVPVSAEILSLERSIGYSPPNSPEGVPRPVRGADQAQVRAQFGAPLRIHAAVGEPPITRWEYDGFTVVFEHQHVLHAVVHRGGL